MEIRPAGERDYSEVTAFYEAMCAELGKRSFLHAGNQGGYPSAEMVKGAIRDRGMIVGTEGGRIIAALIMNHDADPAYDTLQWRCDALPEQVTVMHALRVSPAFAGHGRGKAMVEYGVWRAREAGQKTVRLDTLDENTVAQRLYLGLGFSFTGQIEIEYRDIGEPRVLYCYELVL